MEKRIFRYKKYRYLFGKINHYFIELLCKLNKTEIQKLLTNYNYFKSKVIDELFFDISDEIDEKIIKYSWNFIRYRYKFNFINFINKLKRKNYKLLIEFPLYIFDIKNKKFKIEKIIKPDIIFINNNKKELIVIEIKSAKKYLSFKRQIKKYRKYLDKLFPTYNKKFYLYLISKDELKEVNNEI